jgi:DNA adenine methylase
LVKAATVNRECVQPPLKWAGGKRWLVPLLLEMWQPYSSHRLVEPFVGGMAVALGLQPGQAILNDLNPHLINFYRWLKKGFHLEIPLENNAEYYYKCRLEFNQLILSGKANSLKAAKLFYFLNRTGFNGLCRFNNSNQFNVPFGRYKTINYIRNFTSYSTIFQNWSFTADDFVNISVQPEDFIYSDPPYDVEFTKYSAKDFKWQDQVRLAAWLASHRGPVVASNQATDRIMSLYKNYGFSIILLDAPRRISCTGDRSPAKEVLAYKGI